MIFQHIDNIQIILNNIHNTSAIIIKINPLSSRNSILYQQNTWLKFVLLSIIYRLIIFYNLFTTYIHF